MIEMKEHPLPESSFIAGWYMPNKLCDQIISYYNNNKHLEVEGQVTSNTGEGKVDREHKESFDIRFGPDRWDKPFNDYREHLQQCLMNYVKRYDKIQNYDRFDILENINIQRYPIGGGFKQWHSENMNFHVSSRVLVFMTYLNDVEDGGTEFFYQKMVTPAKKGLTVIWPPAFTHTHRGIPSKTKEKMIVTGWYRFLD